MPVENILQPLIFFGFIASLVLGSQYFEGRRRARIHETIDLAIRQGQPVPAELLEGIARREGSSKPPTPLQMGLILLGAGLGLGIFGQVMGAIDLEARTAITGTAAIPLCIGIAFLVLDFIGRKRA
jgi:hypothetical protein